MLYIDYRRIVKIRVKSSRSTLLSKVLYILKLSINLLLSKKVYSYRNIIGIFNNKTIYFFYKNKKIIEA